MDRSETTTKPRATGRSVRELLSLREVVTLAGVPEKRLRKDIETGILREPRMTRLSDARLAFGWHDVICVAAVYGNAHLGGKLRETALNRLDHVTASLWEIWLETNAQGLARSTVGSGAGEAVLPRDRWHIDIDNYVSLDLDRVLHDVAPRIAIYEKGLSRTEERDDILGGEAVFSGTRLSVSHIGKMIVSGETETHILEDYPYLSKDDIRFAELYFRAHPPVGRPRASEEAVHAEAPAG